MKREKEKPKETSYLGLRIQTANRARLEKLADREELPLSIVTRRVIDAGLKVFEQKNEMRV